MTKPQITIKIMDLCFSEENLKWLRTYLRETKSHSLLIVTNERTIFKYGDIKDTRYIASMRKSVLAVLYGMYDIDLTKTLGELGIDDNQCLTDEEKEATIDMILTARSGIYHPASNAGSSLGNLKRGTKKPGTQWAYNNWDFNVAGTIFEKETGVSIYDALAKLGRDLEFKDYDLEYNKKMYHERKDRQAHKSIHPPYHMHISARDMAKIGLLMLNNGEYKGKQLISRKWVKKMTTMKTKPRETGKRGVGYGYMWWVFANDRHKGGVLEGAYYASGMGNQWLLVVPKLGSVVVMKRKYDPFEANRVVHQLFG